MRLFIAEKPSVAEAIAKQLNPSARKTQHCFDCGEDMVTWCFGHVLQTARPEDYDERYKSWSLQHLPIVPEQWRLLPNQKYSGHIAEMKKLIRQADIVVNAGDPDREGQLLVDEVLQFVGNRAKTQRMWLNAIDPSSIKKALQNLEPNAKYRGFMEAALGRQRADWLIGMNLSRLYSKIWEQRGGPSVVISVGRVQTPTLALVVNRDREIAAFKPHDYYSLQFTFREADGQAIPVKWQRDRAEDKVPPGRLDADGRIIQRSFMEGLQAQLEGAKAVVESVTGEDKVENAPLPYSLSELQKEANKAFGFSPKEVLDGCQALYEKHTLTTYPRTDCGYLKESQHGEAPEVLAAITANLTGELDIPAAVDLTRKSRAWNDGKVTAHHGIIPTPCKKPLSELSAREKALYGMIVKRYLAQFLPPHEYTTVRITVVAGSHELESMAKIIKDIGWRVLVTRDADEDEETPAVDVEEGARGVLLSPELKKHATKPPERFTGALLIDAMKNIHRFVTDTAVRSRLKESEGIGTEATRADIIDGLVDKKFIEERKAGKKVEYHATPLGQFIIDFMPHLFCSPELTAFLEGKLSDVEEGKIPLSEVEHLMVRMVVAAVEDGKEGLGLERLNPSMLPDHVKQALVDSQKRPAKAGGKKPQAGTGQGSTAGGGARRKPAPAAS